MTDAEHDPVSGLESATWWTRGKAIIIDAALFFGALLVPVLLVVVAVVMAWDEAADEASFTGASVGLLVVGIISGVGAFVSSSGPSSERE